MKNSCTKGHPFYYQNFNVKFCNLLQELSIEKKKGANQYELIS